MALLSKFGNFHFKGLDYKTWKDLLTETIAKSVSQFQRSYIKELGSVEASQNLSLTALLL